MPADHADIALAEQCDVRHPFNGLQCHRTMWHGGTHMAETPSLVIAWGFGYDKQSDGSREVSDAR